eukprot:9305570-Pyramimonas_sp.AAC.1
MRSSLIICAGVSVCVLSLCACPQSLAQVPRSEACYASDRSAAIVPLDWTMKPHLSPAEREEWLARVRENPFELEDAPEHVRADAGVVTAAVEGSGYALQFAADECRADRAVVLAAVRSFGSALRHAS